MEYMSFCAFFLVLIKGIPAYAKYHFVNITVIDFGPAVVDPGLQGFR